MCMYNMLIQINIISECARMYYFVFLCIIMNVIYVLQEQKRINYKASFVFLIYKHKFIVYNLC